MKFEHFAINVEQPREMADWYTSHLGLRIVKQIEEPPYMIFLADDQGVLLEIYNNPKAPVLEFRQLHPLVVHLALVSPNPTADKDRLIQAGAELISDDILEDGSHLVMLKDPWGLAIQLCKRAVPMV